MTDSPTLMFSGAFASIMPQSATPLTGYSRVVRLGNSVGEPLEVNAVQFQCGQDRIAFVQFDVLSVGKIVRDRISAHVQGRLRADQIFFIASHTHFAPGIDTDLTLLGSCDDEYIDFVCDTTCRLLDRVLTATPQPVFLRYGESQAYHSINRRKWCWAPATGFPPVQRVMAMQPNFKGAHDRDRADVSRLRGGRSGQAPRRLVELRLPSGEHVSG